MFISHLLNIVMVSVTVLGVRPLGRLVLTRGFRQPRSFPGEFLLSIGLGIFFLEILMLLLAWWGFLHRFVAIILLVLCTGATLGQIAWWVYHRARRGAPDAPSQDGSRLNWHARVLMIALVLTALAYLPGVLLPPMAYDALEYHLGVPHLFIQEGGLFRIDGNVFSNFPLNTEMLYTYSLLLRPDGVPAKLFHFAFALLTVGAAFSIGRAVGRPAAGLGAGLLFLSAPQVLSLAISANIDLAVGYYLICCVLTLHRWLSGPSRSTLALTAAFAGIAMGCKYIAVVLVAAPIAVVVGYCSAFPAGNERHASTSARTSGLTTNLAWFGIVSGIVLSPWLIKNIVYHGNPVFPLLFQFFGGHRWTPHEFEVFQAAHSPTLPQRLGQVAYLLQRVQGSADIRASLFLLWQTLTGSSIVITLLFLPLSRKRLREVPVLYACSGLAFLGYLGWLLLTHQVGRFLVPLFPLVGLPIGYFCFARRKKLPLSELALLGLLILALQSIQSVPDFLQQTRGYDYLLGRITRDEFLERGLPHFFIIRKINELRYAHSPKILMVAEARPFGIRYPVEMSTVFDRSSLIARFEDSGSIEGLRDDLREDTFTHVFFNEIEVARLTDFYGAWGWQDGREMSRIIEQMVNKDYLHEIARSHADWKGRRALLYEIR